MGTVAASAVVGAAFLPSPWHWWVQELDNQSFFNTEHERKKNNHVQRQNLQPKQSTSRQRNVKNKISCQAALVLTQSHRYRVRFCDGLEGGAAHDSMWSSRESRRLPIRAAQLLMPQYSWSADPQDMGEERPLLLVVDKGEDGRANTTFTRVTTWPAAAGASPGGVLEPAMRAFRPRECGAWDKAPTNGLLRRAGLSKVRATPLSRAAAVRCCGPADGTSGAWRKLPDVTVM